MRIAGIGCGKGVSADEVVAAVDAGLLAHGLGRDWLDALATVPHRGGEPGIGAAARVLGLPLLVAQKAALDAALPRLLTHSPASLEATGLGSAAEAAALAASGGRLLGPRVAAGRVTCAIAEGAGS